jgi:AcrR family transcriptional regulator
MAYELSKYKSTALGIVKSGKGCDTGRVTSKNLSRAEARTAQIATIKKVSRVLIASNGVSGLSLREVAREMGVVSSALYRYFATRDDLLTALIFDAYNDLGASVERSDAKAELESAADRFRIAARTVRKWAKRHPNEYSLIYGTPVPNYVAPTTTIEAATRVPRVLSKILSDAQKVRRLPRRASAAEEVEEFLEVGAIEEVLVDVPKEMYVRALMSWNMIFGFLSFELYGHYVGSVRNANIMFEKVLDELVRLLEL